MKGLPGRFDPGTRRAGLLFHARGMPAPTGSVLASGHRVSVHWLLYEFRFVQWKLPRGEDQISASQRTPHRVGRMDCLNWLDASEVAKCFLLPGVPSWHRSNPRHVIRVPRTFLDNLLMAVDSGSKKIMH